MALTTDQLRNLSRLYDRWQSGDAAARDAVQREVDAAGADVARAFAQMFAHADTEASATLLPPISQAMREAAVLAASQPSAGSATSAHSTRLSSTPSDAGEIPTREPGQHVGPYRLIKELGRGGMGVVWLAERADGQHSRQVALKMPLVENLNWLLAARFARERNILASLEHPSIARLYDAGVDQADRNAQPYIAIEYVQGQPITDYVKEKRLKPEATAQLFIRVIEAVAHAHTQLVIHRDIKPSNILVDAKGEPHLLDFGIAKLLDDEDSQAADATQLTRLSGRALTLDYASPEQVNNASLGTASDVYSLGIVLYELLTGSRPYRPKGSTRRDLEQAILDQDPSKPSDQLLTANTGDSESGKSARRMRGDLDTVVLKALRKDPKQRYVTAPAFADDLKRYLAYEPIAAKPDAGWYRVGRFVRRNRVGVLAAAAVVAALGVGLLSTLWQAQRAEREATNAIAEAGQRKLEADRAKSAAEEAVKQATIARRESNRADAEAQVALAQRDRADTEAGFAKQASRRATEQARVARDAERTARAALLAAEESRTEAMLAVDRAAASAGLMRRALAAATGQTTSKEILLDAVKLAETKYENDPATRGQLQFELASLLIPRGERATAERLLESAVQAGTQSGRTDLVAAARCFRASVAVREGDRKGAVAELDDVIEMLERRGLSKDGTLAECLRSRATVRRDIGAPVDTIESDARKALAHTGDRTQDIIPRAHLFSVLAHVAAARGGYAEAIDGYRRSVSMLDTSGDGDLQIASTIRVSLSVAYSDVGRPLDALSGAQEPFDRAVANKVSYGAPPIINYAALLSRLGRLDEANALFAKAIADARSSGSKPPLAYALAGAARVACAQEDSERCLKLATEAQSIFTAILNPQHAAHASVATTLGIANMQRGEFARAGELLSDSVRRFRASQDATVRRVHPLTLLAEALIATGELSAARAAANEALSVATKAMGGLGHTEWMAISLLALAKVERASGQLSQAGELARQASEHARASCGSQSPAYRVAAQMMR